MPTKNKNQFSLTSERAIISFLLQYGNRILADVQNVLSVEDFSTEKNQAIYQCIKNIIEETDTESITIDFILTTAKKINLDKVITVEDVQFLKLCKQQVLSLQELPGFLKQVQFWSIVRQLNHQYNDIDHYLSKLSGSESISEVIAHIEENVLGFIPTLLHEDEIIQLGEFSHEYVQYLGNNPVETIGLPSGFPKWDSCIGGGLRRGTVNIVGSRAKLGKSFFCLNVAKNLITQNVPVLYLDTELNKSIQSTRWTSLHSKIETKLIENGTFVENPHYKKLVLSSLEEIKNLPFDYITVAGKTPEEIVSVIRRWVSKRVGKDANGNMNDALVILDYLKTMDLKDISGFQEHQYLGDIMTKLHNFAVKYDLPMLVTTQLNRDGINRNSSDVVSSSDRILWLCSSLTFIKDKTPEDIASGDPISSGQKKLIVIDTRFGHGMDPTTTYINMITNLARAEMIEGNFNYENQNNDNDISNLLKDEEICI